MPRMTRATYISRVFTGSELIHWYRLLKNGAKRKGEILRAMSGRGEIMVEMENTHFVDPKGNVFVMTLFTNTAGR